MGTSDDLLLSPVLIVQLLLNVITLCIELYGHSMAVYTLYGTGAVQYIILVVYCGGNTVI